MSDRRARCADDFAVIRAAEGGRAMGYLERIPVTLNHFSRVMAGQQPVEDGRERPYVPAIHALLAEAQQKRRGCPRQARA